MAPQARWILCMGIWAVLAAFACARGLIGRVLHEDGTPFQGALTEAVYYGSDEPEAADRITAATDLGPPRPRVRVGRRRACRHLPADPADARAAEPGARLAPRPS